MKPITKVFLVIATLVLALIIWGLFFSGGGILETAFNAIVTPVNDAWKGITGGSNDLIPKMKTDQGATNLDDATDKSNTGGAGN